MSDAHPILFAGVGSPHGDDRAGWLVADAIAADLWPGVIVRKASVPASLLDWMDGVELLALCDACRGGGPVGSLQRFDWDSATGTRKAEGGRRKTEGESCNADVHFAPSFRFPPSAFRLQSSHSFGVSAVLDLAHRLGRLPRHIIVWGIEGGTFEPGDGPSPELERAIPAIVAVIRSALPGANPPGTTSSSASEPAVSSGTTRVPCGPESRR